MTVAVQTETAEISGHAVRQVNNNDCRSEMCAEKNIWNRRKRSRTLRYGDCGLRANCVRVIGKGWELKGGGRPVGVRREKKEKGRGGKLLSLL